MRLLKFSLITPALCSLFISMASCKKFLATYSQNETFIETTTDLDEILIGEGYESSTDNSPQFLQLMDDDIAMGQRTGAYITSQVSGFYSWQPDPRINSDGVVGDKDIFFNRLYLEVSRLNIVLHNIPLLQDKGASADTLRRIAGEAHFLRASYYFMLVNLYGMPYRQQTAETDFGVPLKTEPPVEDKFFARSTTKQVYDQIINDLLSAEKELEGFNQFSSVRANQAAAQALLSRVYLYMEDYENVIAWVDKLINNGGYRVFDLNSYEDGSDFVTRSSPETIFTMSRPIIHFLMQIEMDPPIGEFFQVSDDLVGSYAQEDLRLKAFFIQTSQGYLKTGKRHNTNVSNNDVSDCWLIRLPEILLNKAEALAILGREPEAINTLQELRKNRFKPEDLTIISARGEALVNFIRDERRRELSFESHRWFDLRRYGVNSRFPFGKTIRHISFAYTDNGSYQNGYYELKPYEQDKAAYVIPIARDEIEFNNGLLINEPRPGRPLKQ